jgi:hypothetical protein
VTLVLLAGCVEYDLDIRFDSQTHGQMVQHLHWVETVPPAQLRTWQTALAARVKTVGGQVKWTEGTTATVTVPFNNGAELEQRFNQLFEGGRAGLALPSGETVSATLALTQGNWLVAIRNHLVLTLDFTEIPTGKTLAAPVLQGVELLTGQVQLTTPWGINPLPLDPNAALAPDNSANQWPLHGGQINQIEADFWIPSPIGIGAAAIALLMAIGYGLRYGLGMGSNP